MAASTEISPPPLTAYHHHDQLSHALPADQSLRRLPPLVNRAW
jgi:hypothetical protein